MKSWLRLTLITMTVGGGFTGIATVLQMLPMFGQQDRPVGNYIVALVAITLFAFVVISGLLNAQNPQRTTPLVIALVLQIPLISCPIIAYQFAAGFQVAVDLIDGHPGAGTRLGAAFQIHFFQQQPWGIGINLFALLMLIMLVRSVKTSNSSLRLIADPGIAETMPNNGLPNSATPSSIDHD